MKNAKDNKGKTDMNALTARAGSCIEDDLLEVGVVALTYQTTEKAINKFCFTIFGKYCTFEFWNF